MSDAGLASPVVSLLGEWCRRPILRASPRGVIGQVADPGDDSAAGPLLAVRLALDGILGGDPVSELHAGV